MAKATRGELIARLRERVKDPAGDEAAFSEEEVVEVLRAALRALSAWNPWVTTATLSVTANQRRFAFAPSGKVVLGVRCIYYENQGTLEYWDYDEGDWEWDPHRGEIAWSYWWGENRSLTVEYAAMHSAWTDTGDASDSLREEDEDALLVTAELRCLEILQTETARFVSWTRGTWREDPRAAQQAIAARVDAIRAELTALSGGEALDVDAGRYAPDPAGVVVIREARGGRINDWRVTLP